MRVVVVGTGIVGSSAAFHLADAGVDVTVVDGAHEGTATRAGAGIICPWPTASTDDDFVALYVAAAEALPGIVARVESSGGGDTSFRRIGAIVVATEPGALDEVEQRVRARSAGSEVIGEICRIDGTEVQGRLPPARSDLPGLWIGGGARIDGRAMRAALLGAAGVEPHRGRAELAVDGARVTGVLVDGESVDADVVVVAGGAWTRELLAPLGVTVDVEPQKGQILHLDVGRDRDDRPDRPPTGEWPSMLPLGPHYLVPFEDGRVVVGATRETGSGFDTRVTAAGQREVLDAALEWAPGLADATVVETRVGLRPLAAAGRPTLGPVDGVDGLVIGTGLGASGLTIGPLAGRMLAEQVLRG